MIYLARILVAVDSGLIQRPRSFGVHVRFGCDQDLVFTKLHAFSIRISRACQTTCSEVLGKTGLHHARRAVGKGFCAVHGLAIAAKKSLGDGCQRVLILDMDAHCGGGTQDCISNESKVFQVDLSVHPFDRYQPAHNSHLVMVDHGADYLTCIEQELETLASRDMGFDLCLYNAGMDPFEFCPHGGLEGVSKRVLLERERMVFRWCLRQRIPVAFVIAGGYLGSRLERQDLVGLHRMTIEAAAEELQESKPSATA